MRTGASAHHGVRGPSVYPLNSPFRLRTRHDGYSGRAIPERRVEGPSRPRLHLLEGGRGIRIRPSATSRSPMHVPWLPTVASDSTATVSHSQPTNPTSTDYTDDRSGQGELRNGDRAVATRPHGRGRGLRAKPSDPDGGSEDLPRCVFTLRALRLPDGAEPRARGQCAQSTRQRACRCRESGLRMVQHLGTHRPAGRAEPINGGRCVYVGAGRLPGVLLHAAR